MTNEEMVEALNTAIDIAQSRAVRCISPAQLAALSAAGLTVVPDWVATDIVRILAKAMPKRTTPLEAKR